MLGQKGIGLSGSRVLEAAAPSRGSLWKRPTRRGGQQAAGSDVLGFLQLWTKDIKLTPSFGSSRQTLLFHGATSRVLRGRPAWGGWLPRLQMSIHGPPLRRCLDSPNTRSSRLELGVEGGNAGAWWLGGRRLGNARLWLLARCGIVSNVPLT